MRCDKPFSPFADGAPPGEASETAFERSSKETQKETDFASSPSNASPAATSVKGGGEEGAGGEDIRSTKYSCASCGCVACEACAYNLVFECEREEVVRVCDHCFAKSCRIISTNKRLTKSGWHISELTQRAVQSCLELNNRLDNYEGLRLHIGIGVGEIMFLHVGGLRKRWEFLMAGDALTEMGIAEGAAQSGEVCLCYEAWDAVKLNCAAEPVEQEVGSNISPEEAAEMIAKPPLKVIDIKQHLEKHPSERRWVKWNSVATEKMWRRTPFDKPDAGRIETLLARYVPGAIRSVITNDNYASMIAEFRTVSVRVYVSYISYFIFHISIFQ